MSSPNNVPIQTAVYTLQNAFSDRRSRLPEANPGLELWSHWTVEGCAAGSHRQLSSELGRGPMPALFSPPLTLPVMFTSTAYPEF